ncbi:hypothetical protein [Mechercharimyces sp. CAU 1602]|uniref:hypothetical protein n=1 Tax=Mechercharimyces sp. CAU 1602 TaxID=2973933 RepID=UPI0021612AA5|nr:hypothetical protein [Mechercharimyces sp. CAU 1602]MCS1351539.1 hypothetical protein [Mechercharimyces sp. CAU 1602]
MVPNFFTLVRNNWASLWGLSWLSYLIYTALSTAAFIVYYIFLFIGLFFVALLGATTAAGSSPAEFIDNAGVIAFLFFAVYLIILSSALYAILCSFHISSLLGIIQEIVNKGRTSASTLIEYGFKNFFKTILFYITLFLIAGAILFLFIAGTIFTGMDVLILNILGVVLVLISAICLIFYGLLMMHAPIFFTVEDQSIRQSISNSVHVFFTSMGNVLMSGLISFSYILLLVLLYLVGILLFALMALLDGHSGLQIFIGLILFICGVFYVLFLVPIIPTLSLKSIYYRYVKYIRPTYFPTEPAQAAVTASHSPPPAIQQPPSVIEDNSSQPKKDDSFNVSWH